MEVRKIPIQAGAASKKTIRRKLRRKRKQLAGVQIVYPNERLSAIVGWDPRSREEVIDDTWRYIRDNALVTDNSRWVEVNNELLLKVFRGHKRVSRNDVRRLVILSLLPGDPRVKPRPPKLPSPPRRPTPSTTDWRQGSHAIVR